MEKLPRYYFQDLRASVMEKIITGMTNGEPQPTREEMEDWITQELEREAPLLAANG